MGTLATGKRDKIKELLGTGLSGTTVATAVGVDQSYVAQLMMDQDFRDEVQELRSKSLTAKTSRDLSIDDLEDKLIEQLGDMIEDGRFHKPSELLAAFRTVNGAQRRGAPVRAEAINTDKIVQLQIPVAVKTIINVNSKGEVIEVDGQTLVTMPSGQLVQQIADQRGEGSEGAFNRLRKAIQKVGAKEVIEVGAERS